MSLSVPLARPITLHSPQPPGTPSAASPPLSTSPTAAVLGGALALLNVHEHGGNNRGEMVDSMLYDVHELPGAPWCVAYVRRVGYYTLLDPVSGVSQWPLPDTASCQALADFARAKGVLATVPVHGDVFVLWIESRRGFHHTGFLLSVTDTSTGYVCTTIEGNTNDDGSPDGNAVAIRTRTFPHGGTTRFIDWTRLLPAGYAV